MTESLNWKTISLLALVLVSIVMENNLCRADFEMTERNLSSMEVMALAAGF